MVSILTDNLHRTAYSTDASVYKERPYGVAYPSSAEDIGELISEARKLGTNIIARAAGTSIAGQVVGNGIVADISRYLNHIIEINPEERYAWVEPGVVRDELNIACKPYGLFFSPETSTSNRCCIGGMMGNNSCGTHSLVYGSTRRHVLETDVVLADGTDEHIASYSVAQLEDRFGREFWNNNQVPNTKYQVQNAKEQVLIEQIYAQLINFALDNQTCQLIFDNYPDPSLARRSCGYAIDEVIADLADVSKPLSERTINLCQLLCGSEGTLAFAYKIKVSLDPLPQKYAVVVCAHCISLEASFNANLIALRHSPEAIELMDNEILQLSKSNTDVDRSFIKGNPAALLFIELRNDTPEFLEYQAMRLISDLQKSGYVTDCTRVYGDSISKVWNLRKAGLGILSGMKGDAKPTGVIEDTAVAPARLPDYMADFREMLKRLGTSCVFYGHISTGELHLRPILNLKTEEGRRLFRNIAYETTLLVRKHRGTISGEHGDGRLRGEFIPLQYGEPVYQLMRQVKYLWDKDNIFNPHKIVDTPPMDEQLRVQNIDFRFQNLEFRKTLNSQQPSTLNSQLSTIYNWKAPFDECAVEGATGAHSQQHAMLCSVEQCNGSGDCRKSNLIGGTLCPAYKVSHDELQTTRARANILREYLYQLSTLNSQQPSTLNSQLSTNEIKEILSSCLACKGCRRECPSGVDMTRLRAEVLQYIYDKNGIPFRTWLVAHNADIQHLGSLFPHLYIWFATNKLTSKILKKTVGFAPERTIPKIRFQTSDFRFQISDFRFQTSEFRFQTSDFRGKIYLFLDEFTKYQEAELAHTFILLLNRLGYEVIIPKHVESGRAAISKGCLKQAKKYAEKNLRLLKDIISDESPLVGIEPSCILTFRDEYPDLVNAEHRQDAKRLAADCLLFDEFLMREVEKGHITSDMFSDIRAEIWLHGHCHQKALVGVEKSAAVLDLPRGTTVHVIPSGCCGMAGSFGYEKEHYKTSIAIGEMILFPAVRKAVENNTIDSPVFIAAPGTSCRTQIFDGTGIKALHPIEILYRLLGREI